MTAPSWTADRALNDQADQEAARAQTVMFHQAIPDGTNEVATAVPTWTPGGDAGPDPSWQPAQVGVTHAAPLVSVPAGTLTHISYHDADGMWGWDELIPSITFADTTDHTFYLALGPRA